MTQICAITGTLIDEINHFIILFENFELKSKLTSNPKVTINDN